MLWEARHCKFIRMDYGFAEKIIGGFFIDN